MFSVFKEADAAYIVKACNAYPELVAFSDAFVAYLVARSVSPSSAEDEFKNVVKAHERACGALRQADNDA
jgi:hypothetical protein